MKPRSLRILQLLPVAAALLTVTAGTASAQLTVRPSSCHVLFDQARAANVYAYDNPNPDAVEIPYGPNNIILQAPNFRAGQPTMFLPGHVENAFAAPHNYLRTPVVEWYLQGLVAASGDRCQAPGAPRNVAAPSIQGTPTGGSMVTLDPGTWSGATTVRRLYRVDVCDETNGCGTYRADAGSVPRIDAPVPFTVPSDVPGRRLRLTVFAYSSRGVATASSALSSAVGPAGPAAAAPAARIPPTGTSGIRLYADRAMVPLAQQEWGGVPAPSVVHQWQRCTQDCADIPGDTGLVHRVVPADVGASLKVVTTATSESGEGSITSAEIPITTVPGPASEPVPLALPQLSGTAGVGLPTHARVGAWAGDDSPDVQWQRCDGAGCSDIAGATGGTYVPTAADTGEQLRAVVLAQNDDVPTSGFLPAAFSWATELTASVTAGPQNVAPPQIGGSGDVGSPLRLSSAGAWSAALDASTTTWERCRDGQCQPIAGATGDTYVPTAADAGATVRAVVAARTASGVTSAESPPLGPIGRVRGVFAPSVEGEAVEGSTLVASFGDWLGTPTPVFAPQWLSCDPGGGACSEIPGATGAMYRPGTPDVGRALRVRVHGSNAFSSDQLLSPATAPVASRATAGSPAEPDATAPRLTRLALSRRTFRVARGRTALAARAARGARLRFELSEDAWLRVDVMRANRRRRTPLGTLTRVARTGKGSFRFTGRLGRTRLRPGSYRLRVRATDASGNRSRARTVRFRVVRG